MVFFLLIGAVLGTIGPSVVSDGNSKITVEVMIDFGNGNTEWAKIVLNENLTAINATELACLELNIDLTVRWSQWGAFVSEIGGMSPYDWSWWWGFFVWNYSQNIWESSSVGASSLELEDGDIIGWSPAWDYLDPAKPIPKPSMKYPWAGFQHDSIKSGFIKKSGPISNSVSWVFDTQTIEMSASPAIAEGKVIVNNWGGTFCLNEEGELLWKNEEVKGGYSPAIGHSKVFVGGKDGYLYALNISSGEIIWNMEITSHPGISGVTSSPTLVRDKIYVGSFNFSGGPGQLFCIDEGNGEVLWKSPTSSSIYFSSPSVTDNRVHVGTMGLYNSSTLQWKEPYGLYCFDATDGQELWYFPINGSLGSSPTIVDDIVVFTSKDGYIYCLNAESGDLVWKKNIGSSVSSPAVQQDRIYVGTGEMNGAGKFLCLDIDGNILWEYIPNGAVQSSPAFAKDYVYFATNVLNGTIYCLERESGDLVWEYKPFPEQYIISSPAIVHEKLYIGCDNGRLYSFGGLGPNVTVDYEGSSEKIHVGEDVRFLHRDEEYKMIITSLDTNFVTLNIDSIPGTISIDVGETKYLDTDENGKNDLSISIISVNASSQTASVTIKKVNEPRDESWELMPLFLLIAVIILIGLIIVGISINLNRRKAHGKT
jgi:outer membrane protein assembly factor BamB